MAWALLPYELRRQTMRDHLADRLLAADKGALCLTMSALDAPPEQKFAQMRPGLLAIFSFKGWMALVWGPLLMPVGVMPRHA
jgi:hypothetical protein